MTNAHRVVNVSIIKTQRSAIKLDATPPDKKFAVLVNVLPKKDCRSSSLGGTAHRLTSKHSLHEKQETFPHPEYKTLKTSNLGDFSQMVWSTRTAQGHVGATPVQGRHDCRGHQKRQRPFPRLDSVILQRTWQRCEQPF